MLNSYIRRSAEREMMKITPETMTQKPVIFSACYLSCSLLTICFNLLDIPQIGVTQLRQRHLKYVIQFYKQISLPLKANMLEARHLSTSISTYLRIIVCVLSSLLRVDLFLDFFRFNHFRHHVLLAKCS